MPFGSRDSQIAELIVQARDEATSVLQHVGSELQRVGEIAGGVVVGQVGYQALYALVNGVEQLGGSLITSNSSLEQFTKSLEVFYQSSSRAQQASDFLTQFAITTPDTLENIRQAGLEMVAIGQDLTQVMPAIGNAAAAMGTTTTLASHALARAFQGDFEIMRQELHISADELVAFGLKMDSSGHVMRETVIPAFEAFVKARYGDAMAAQMQTGAGAWSNVEDAFQHAAQVIGKPLFADLTREMNSFLQFLDAHKADIAAFSDAVGQGLAGAARAVMDLAGTVMSDIPPAIGVIRGLWTAIAPGVDAVRGAVQTIENYLQQHLQPTVRAVLTQVIVWWDDHAGDVASTLTTIATDVQQFLLFLGSNMASGLEIMRGIAQVGWGAIQAAFAVGQTLIEADATKHSQAILDAYTTVMFGFDDIAQGIEEALTRMVDQGLLPAVDAFHDWAHKALEPFETWAAQVGLSFMAVWMRAENFVATISDSIIRQMHEFLSKIPADLPVFGSLHRDLLPSDQRYVPLPHPDITAELTKMLPAMMAATGARDTYTPLASDARLARDIRDVHDFWQGEKQRTLTDLATTFGDNAALAELLRMRGVEGPTHPAGAAQRSAADRRAEAELDAFMRQLQRLAGSGLGLETLKGGGLSGAGGAADHLPVPGGAGTATDPIAVRQAQATVLQQAKEQFELDRLNHASQQKLLADIAAILVDMKRAGASQLDIDLERKRDMDLIMGTPRQAQGQGLPAWMAASAAASARSAGFGSTIADYGFGARDNTGAIIASLQRQLAAATEQISVLRSVLRAVEKTADTISRPGDAALWRRHGMPQPAL
jgi:hypothetical protein